MTWFSIMLIIIGILALIAFVIVKYPEYRKRS